MTIWRNCLFLILAFVFLSGCGTPGIDKLEHFSSESPDALVVVGLELDLNEYSLKYYMPSVDLYWAPYDHERDQLIDKDGLLAVVHRCTSTEGECKDRRRFFRAVRVPPGHYILANMSLGKYRGGIEITSFLGLKEDSFGRTQVNDDAQPSKTTSHKFNVAPGEIVYIGTFVIGGLYNRVGLKDYSVDLRSAAMYLSNFPNVRGVLTYRRPLGNPPAF